MSIAAGIPSDIESELISCIEAGTTFDLIPNHARSVKSRAPQNPSSTRIEADFIRRILLKRPFVISSASGDGENAVHRPIHIAGPGIQIRHATIVGTLNLDDLAGPDDAALPGLHFEECWFESIKGVSLKRAHLRSLTFINCRLTQIQAEEAVIDGPVQASGITPPPLMALEDAAGIRIELTGSWVVFRGARIAGHINCAETRFQTWPRGKDDRPFVLNSTHSRYALDLRASNVGGSVLLRPDVVAIGGVSLNLAHIQGSVWVNGAELIKDEDCAFSADYSEIQGSLYLRAYDPHTPLPANPHSYRCKPFIARGEVSLFAAKIGGSLYLEGAKLKRFDPSRPGEQRSLDASTSTIGGNCKLSGWQSNTVTTNFETFEAEEDILLNSAFVRNDINFWGATFCGVFANNVRVGGDFNGSIFDKPDLLTPANIENLRMKAREIHIENAVIDGDLFMIGAKFGDPAAVLDNKQGLFARSVEIGGNCHLTTFPDEGEGTEPVARFECWGRILVQEATIGNSLVMSGAKIVWRKDSRFPAVDFSGTTIGGHAKFQTWQPETSGPCYPCEVDAGETALRLVGIRIAQKLILNGARITSTRIAINASNAEIGAKASLCPYTDRFNNTQVYPFSVLGQITFAGAVIKLGLDMTRAKLSAIGSIPFGVRKFVALDITQARVKTLILYLAEVFGQVILKHAEIDIDLNSSRARFHGRVNADYARVGAKVDLTGTKIWSGSARRLFKEIVDQGVQSGQTQEQAMQSVRDELSRQHAGKLIEPDLSLHSARIGGTLVVDKLEVFPAIDDPADRAHGCPVEFNHITVDLRGLTIQELQDNGGGGWNSSVRLWLDGFCYTRLTPPAPNIVASSWPRGAHHRLGLVSQKGSEMWRSRLDWLGRQYSGRPEVQRAEFTPGAYEQVVKTFNADGLYGDANHIASVKITRERKVNPRLRHRALWWLFGFFFDYGFSPTRAFFTFLAFIALGSSAAWVANYGLPWDEQANFGKVLYATHSHAIKLKEQNSSGEGPVDTYSDEPNGDHCGRRVQSVLYALDVFVPVLDLRQQAACYIDPDKMSWRYGQAAYAVLGWILTPITLLTFSGILRKHLER